MFENVYVDGKLTGCNVTMFSETDPLLGFTGMIIRKTSVEKADLTLLRKKVFEMDKQGKLDDLRQKETEYFAKLEEKESIQKTLKKTQSDAN